MMNRQASPTLVYAAALILAACSLLYELLIAQALSTLATNTVVWYSVTIGIYLASMGVGAILHDRYTTDRSWSRLFRVEILLSAVGLLAMPLLNFAHTFALVFDFHDAELQSNVVFFGSAFLLTAAIGILTGFELPLLIDLGNQASGDQRVTNRVLAADYMGSLVGGLAFPLVLLPNLSLLLVGLLTSAANLVVALLALYWFLPRSERSYRRLASCGALASALVLGLVFAQPIDRYFVKNYYFYFNYAEDLGTLFGTMDNVDDIHRVRSLYQRIDLVHDELGYDTDMLIDIYSTKFVANPSQPKNYVLFLNGDYQLASSYEEFYHEFFAHVPIITNGAVPGRVLVMGGGDGLLIRELVKYPDIDHILHVDLDRRLVQLAMEHPTLVAMNERALEDERVETVFDDAYRYIRNSTERFDAIYLDFPYVNDYNLSKLYSREFFHFVRNRLAPGGFIVLDTPGLESRARMREVYTSTVSAAGFGYVWPYTSKVERFRAEAAGVLLEAGVPRGALRSVLRAHADSLEYSFVIGREEAPGRPLYLDPRIELHALTSERLTLTLRAVPERGPELNPDAVNSIFRPTLPANRVWGIRTAW
jgi:spermidine synthase